MATQEDRIEVLCLQNKRLLLPPADVVAELGHVLETGPKREAWERLLRTLVEVRRG